MKPKVILLSAFLSPFRSGAEACAEEVALRLCDRFDITIITARMRRDLLKRDMLQGKVPVIRVGFGLGFDKWLYPLLAPWACRGVGARRWRAWSEVHLPESVPSHLLPPGAPSGRPYTRGGDVLLIHAILETFAGLALFLCRFMVPKARRMLTLQTTNRSFLKGIIIRSPHAVTAISRALAEVAVKLGRQDVTVIPNGVDIAAIRAACERVPKVPGRILFVGRLERMKGVDTLLTAFAELSMSNSQFSNSQLRIAGEGSERSHLEHLAKELGIADRVTFLGHIPPPAVYEEFAAAEIFCGLSRSEALGNVFLEAQAAGCAVIGTRVGGIPEIVEHEVTGLLVQPDNVEAATAALQRFLPDDALRTSLSERGRGRAQSFAWDAVALRYERLYRNLLP